MATKIIMALSIASVALFGDSEVATEPAPTQAAVFAASHCEGLCLGGGILFCDRKYMEFPCHSWTWGGAMLSTRGSDWHEENREDTMGRGSCSSAGHVDPSCRMVARVEQNEILLAVSDMDADRLAGVVSREDGAWIEFNDNRKAVQILVPPCDRRSSEVVIAHVPVQESTYWKRAIEHLSVSVSP